MNVIDAILLVHDHENAVHAVARDEYAGRNSTESRNRRNRAHHAIVDALAGPAPEDRAAKVHRLRQIAADATAQADALAVDLDEEDQS